MLSISSGGGLFSAVFKIKAIKKTYVSSDRYWVPYCFQNVSCASSSIYVFLWHFRQLAFLIEVETGPQLQLSISSHNVKNRKCIVISKRNSKVTIPLVKLSTFKIDRPDWFNVVLYFEYQSKGMNKCPMLHALLLLLLDRVH